jgi:hypothetical protein
MTYIIYIYSYINLYIYLYIYILYIYINKYINNLIPPSYGIFPGAKILVFCQSEELRKRADHAFATFGLEHVTLKGDALERAASIRRFYGDPGTGWAMVGWWLMFIGWINDMGMDQYL